MSLNQDFLQNDFERVFQDERLKTDVIYQGQSFWKDVWHRFIQNIYYDSFSSVNSNFCSNVKFACI